MKVENLFKPNLFIKHLSSNTKEGVLKEMVDKLYEGGYITSSEKFLEDVLKREEIAHTAFEGGVATPHAKSEVVKKAAVLVGIKKDGIDFSNGEEQATKLFFLIAVPVDNPNLHIDVLSKLASIIEDEKKVNNILNANNIEDVLQNFKDENETQNVPKDKGFVVAVTACPTGIAHTFMARDALVKAANEMGVEIKVETNGTDGRNNTITKEDLKRAKGVILAINKSVDEERFNGSRVIKVGAKEGISNAKGLIQDVLDGKGEIANFKTQNVSEESSNDGKNVYKYLMNGVSYMLPLVVSGGILIALAFLVDTIMGNGNAGSDFGSVNVVARTLKQIGGAAFGLFVPILAGFIAFSIGKKSALTAGLVAGALAVSGGSGFLGALVGGLFAGFVVKLMNNKIQSISDKFRGLYLILVIPVVSVLITGLAMFFVLNPIVSVVNNAMINFLNNMNSGSRLIFGAILGAMMAVDMGGPVNKAAYVFGTGTLEVSLATGGSTAMAAVMAGGMVPPLAIAIATTIFKNKYTKDERQAGISNYIMGLSFITEGAIPFAASNPIRVIPACIIGSAVAGALSMLFNIKIPAPHGGILVMFLSNNIFLYILSVLIGSIVAGLILGILKKKDK